MSGTSSLPPSGGSQAPPVGEAEATCLLLVDERVVLRAPAPPEVEYLLFDAPDIELRASEPGRVREHGYHTSAARARERLATHGATASLAAECAAALLPTLAQAYARGPAARQIVRYLGPAELLQATSWDPSRKVYRGTYLDLAALAGDVCVAHASALLQALHLALVLAAADASAAVFLSTDAWTKQRRPGERTHRRVPLDAIGELPSALASLAAASPRPDVEEPLPRAEAIAFLRARADSAPDEDARALYGSLERAIAVRERPDRGPLSLPEIWQIEEDLDRGQLGGVVEAIDALERVHGRTPGTAYLRGRAALALGLEAPGQIAERVSALALSMTSFQELSLLAAEAWLAAGEARRAMPYARHLVDAPGIDEGLLLRAQRVLAQAVRMAPEGSTTLAGSTRPPPAAHASAGATTKLHSVLPVSPPDPNDVRTFERGPSRTPTVRGTPPGGTELPSTPGIATSTPPSSTPHAATGRPLASARPEAAPSSTHELRRWSTPPPVGSGAPTPLELDVPPPRSASFTLELSGPDAAPTTSPPASSGSPERSTHRRMAGVRLETNAPRSRDPRAEPDDEPFPMPTIPPQRAPKLDFEAPPASPPPVAKPSRRRASAGPPSEAAALLHDVHGASLPAYEIERARTASARTNRPPPGLGAIEGDELVEHLAPPPGSDHALPLAGAPRTALDARIQLTHLARALARDYRVQRGIVLRADVSGIEAMQAVLLDTFPERTLLTAADALEVKRHGAVLSEILARRLGAEWVDLSSAEPGHWAMLVPPDTRVWPLGRVARLIATRHHERDLVSYFLELSLRARPR